MSFTLYIHIECVCCVFKRLITMIIHLQLWSLFTLTISFSTFSSRSLFLQVPQNQVWGHCGIFLAMKSEGLNVCSSGALERCWRSSSVHSTGAWSPQAVRCSTAQQGLTVDCPPTRVRMTCWLERAESEEEISGFSVACMATPVAGSVQAELRTRGRTSHPCRPRSEVIVVVMSSGMQGSFNSRQGSYRTQTTQVRHTIIASLSYSLLNTHTSTYTLIISTGDLVLYFYIL